MNKRQKIVVSIVGITIVLLALLGITYAYYLTRIEGNTNTNSISITTADLKIEYADGNGIITAKNIMPGDTVGTKTFTVTNKGNTSIDNYGISLDYAEIIKDNKIVLPSIFERPEDFEITLTCKDNNNDDCNGFTGNFNNESIIMTTSSIEPNEVHNYSLAIYYANPDIDQSNDMGKNLNLKVNIFSVNESADINGTITGVDSTYVLKVNSEPKLSTIVNGKYKLKGLEVGTHTLSIIDKNGNVVKSQKLVIETGNNPGISETTVDNETVPLITINESSRVAPLNTTYDKATTTITNSGTTMSKFNPYENKENTLAYNIINNAILEKNGTELVSTPPTKVAEEISFANETVRTISKTIEVVNDLWRYGDTEEEAFEGTEISTCTDELVGKWLYDVNSYFDVEETIDLIKVTGCDGTLPMYNEEIIESVTYEKVLSLTSDDYGTSYYFRGNVEDNYVNFAGMCWKIVRILGDGSIKLILHDYDNVCGAPTYDVTSVIGNGSFGYATEVINGNTIELFNFLEPSKSGERSMVKAFYNFQNDKLNGYLDKLKRGDWCIGDIAYTRTGAYLQRVYSLLGNNGYDYDYLSHMYYDSYRRLTIDRGEPFYPTLKCNGSIINKYKTYDSISISEKDLFVGAITADEITYAGGKYNLENYDYYLKGGGYSWFWTMSPSGYNATTHYDGVFILGSNGMLNSDRLIYNWSFRPLIQLKSGISISSGEGTIDKPYVIE